MKLLFHRVKYKRHCVGPNSGFLAQLATYETMGWHIDNNNGQYRLYKLQVAARSVMKGMDCHNVLV